MKYSNVELYNNLSKHNGGIHMIVGRAGDGKTAALFSFCEHIAPICFSEKSKMLLICSERKPVFDKQINVGEMRQFYRSNKPAYISTSQMIKKRLDCIEGISLPDTQGIVRLGSLVDMLELHNHGLDGFIALIKDAVERCNYKTILTDIDLNSLDIPHENELIAGRAKTISAAMSIVAGVTTQAKVNLYVTTQARRSLREVEEISNTDIGGNRSIVHMANSIFSVCMNKNGKMELVLTSIKNRYGNNGEKFCIPFQREF